MTLKFSNFYPAKAILASALLSTGVTACASPVPNTLADTVQTVSTEKMISPVVLTLEKGQLLSIVSIVSDPSDDAKKAVAEYYETAFPLGESYGLKRIGQLRVAATPVGEHKAEALVFYTWPSAKAEQAFEADPGWAAIKTLRPRAWEELRIYTEEMEEDTILSFDPDKTYTLAMAWLNPENPDHYDRYMAGIKASAESVGGKFLYKMFHPKFESNKIKDGGPGQITLVEWDSPQGLKDFGETQGFKDNAHYLGTGVTRFEILALSAG